MTPVTLYLALFGAILFLIFMLFAFILLDPLIPTASDFETRRPQQKRKYSSLGWLFATNRSPALAVDDEEHARLLERDSRPTWYATSTASAPASPHSPTWPDSPLSILVNWRPVRWANGRSDSVATLVSPRRVV